MPGRCRAVPQQLRWQTATRMRVRVAGASATGADAVICRRSSGEGEGRGSHAGRGRRDEARPGGGSASRESPRMHGSPHITTAAVDLADPGTVRLHGQVPRQPSVRWCLCYYIYNVDLLSAEARAPITTIRLQVGRTSCTPLHLWPRQSQRIRSYSTRHAARALIRFSVRVQRYTWRVRMHKRAAAVPPTARRCSTAPRLCC